MKGRSTIFLFLELVRDWVGLICFFIPVLFFESIENKRERVSFEGGVVVCVNKKKNPNHYPPQKSPQPFVNTPPEPREGGEKHFLITPLKNGAALTFQVPRQEMKVGNWSSAAPRSRCYYGLPERFFLSFFCQETKMLPTSNGAN